MMSTFKISKRALNGSQNNPKYDQTISPSSNLFPGFYFQNMRVILKMNLLVLTCIITCDNSKLLER